MAIPRVQLYADNTALFVRQLLTDALVLAWVVLWAWAGHAVHDATLGLAGPGHRAEESANSLADSMSDAGDFLGDVPLVGDGVASPFDRAASASESLAAAGRAQVRAVESLATWLGWSIALVPVLPVALVHVPRRVRFAREATAGRRFVDGPADLELFALRAMARQPLHVLARITDDPVGALRRQDRAVVDALATLELRASGLAPPTPAGTPVDTAARGGGRR